MKKVEAAPGTVPATGDAAIASPQPLRAGRVQFGAVDFAKEAGDGEKEKVLSPTQGGPEDEDAFLGE